MVALYVRQMIVAKLRQRFRRLERVVDNLRLGGITRFDLRAKLREANVDRVARPGTRSDGALRFGQALMSRSPGTGR